MRKVAGGVRAVEVNIEGMVQGNKGEGKEVEMGASNTGGIEIAKRREPFFYAGTLKKPTITLGPMRREKEVEL